LFFAAPQVQVSDIEQDSRIVGRVGKRRAFVVSARSMSPRDRSNCATAWYARAVCDLRPVRRMRFAGHRGQEIAVYDAIVHRAASTAAFAPDASTLGGVIVRLAAPRKGKPASAPLRLFDMIDDRFSAEPARRGVR